MIKFHKSSKVTLTNLNATWSSVQKNKIATVEKRDIPMPEDTRGPVLEIWGKGRGGGRRIRDGGEEE